MKAAETPTRYMIPMRLWSSVPAQDQKPVLQFQKVLRGAGSARCRSTAGTFVVIGASLGLRECFHELVDALDPLLVDRLHRHVGALEADGFLHVGLQHRLHDVL